MYCENRAEDILSTDAEFVCQYVIYILNTAFCAKVQILLR
jgi:hypothetical protein